MRNKFASMLSLFLCLTGGPATSQERVTIDAAVVAVPATTHLAVARLRLDWADAVIEVHLREVDAFNIPVGNGKWHVAKYEGLDATNALRALNIANLSVKSLHRRLMERLQADGKLPAGTVSGAPQ